MFWIWVSGIAGLVIGAIAAFCLGDWKTLNAIYRLELSNKLRGLREEIRDDNRSLLAEPMTGEESGELLDWIPEAVRKVVRSELFPDPTTAANPAAESPMTPEAVAQMIREETDKCWRDELESLEKRFSSLDDFVRASLPVRVEGEPTLCGRINQLTDRIEKLSQAATAQPREGIEVPLGATGEIVNDRNPTEASRQFGMMVRSFRQAKDMSLASMATRALCTERQMEEIERGKFVPTPGIIDLIVAVLAPPWQARERMLKLYEIAKKPYLRRVEG